MSVALFNYIESVLWFAIAVVILLHAIKWGRSNPYFTLQILSFIGFACFGISDVIEASTGAWWRPFSLFVFKSACVLLLLYCFYRYIKIKNHIS